MTKKEAIQAMLDGYKITNNSGCYAIFNGDEFVWDNGDKLNMNTMHDEWELYQEPSKTEPWAKFRCWDYHRKEWFEPPHRARTLKDFKHEWRSSGYSHHHEIPNTRVDLPVVED